MSKNKGSRATRHECHAQIPNANNVGYWVNGLHYFLRYKESSHGADAAREKQIPLEEADTILTRFAYRCSLGCLVCQAFLRSGQTTPDLVGCWPYYAGPYLGTPTDTTSSEGKKG